MDKIYECKKLMTRYKSLGIKTVVLPFKKEENHFDLCHCLGKILKLKNPKTVDVLQNFQDQNLKN